MVNLRNKEGRSLYFANRNDIMIWKSFGTKLAVIKLYNDSRVFGMYNKYKTDQFYIQYIQQ
jgi:hypothetical protein